MNTNDLNARSSLTRRQRRSQAPRVECLESRELLTYPAAGVNFLIYQAVVHHENTAFQVIAGVDNSLRNDLAGPGSPLAALTAAGVTHTTANAFVELEFEPGRELRAERRCSALPAVPVCLRPDLEPCPDHPQLAFRYNGLYQNGTEIATTFFRTRRTSLHIDRPELTS